MCHFVFLIFVCLHFTVVSQFVYFFNKPIHCLIYVTYITGNPPLVFLGPVRLHVKSCASFDLISLCFPLLIWLFYFRTHSYSTGRDFYPTPTCKFYISCLSLLMPCVFFVCLHVGRTAWQRFALVLKTK